MRSSADDESRPLLQDSRRHSTTSSSSKPHTSNNVPSSRLLPYLWVLIVHLVVACSWGMNTSFGVFQKLYSEDFGLSLSQASLVGSSQTTLFLLVGLFSGRLSEAGYFRALIIAGGFFQVAGLVLLAWCNGSFGGILATHGLLFGLGGGIAFTPCLTLIASAFPNHRAAALSLANLGSATGGVVFPALLSAALPAVGFSNSVRIIGLVVLVSYVLAVVILPAPLQRAGSGSSGSTESPKTMRSTPFALYLVGAFFFWLVLYFGLYYITPYGLSKGGMSQSDSVALLMVMVTCGLPFRVLPGVVADRWLGALNILGPACFVACLLLLSWARTTSSTGLWIFSGLYGMALATLQSLFTPAILSLTPDPARYGSRIGTANAVVSLAVIAGPPLVGKMIEAAGGDFWPAQLFAACAMFLGGVFVVAARVAHTGPVFRMKA